MTLKKHARSALALLLVGEGLRKALHPRQRG